MQALKAWIHLLHSLQNAHFQLHVTSHIPTLLFLKQSVNFAVLILSLIHLLHWYYSFIIFCNTGNSDWGVDTAFAILWGVGLGWAQERAKREHRHWFVFEVAVCTLCQNEDTAFSAGQPVSIASAFPVELESHSVQKLREAVGSSNSWALFNRGGKRWPRKFWPVAYRHLELTEEAS